MSAKLACKMIALYSQVLFGSIRVIYCIYKCGFSCIIVVRLGKIQIASVICLTVCIHTLTCLQLLGTVSGELDMSQTGSITNFEML